MKPNVKHVIIKATIILSQFFLIFDCWGLDYEIKIPEELSEE